MNLSGRICPHRTVSELSLQRSKLALPTDLSPHTHHTTGLLSKSCSTACVASHQGSLSLHSIFVHILKFLTSSLFSSSSVYSCIAHMKSKNPTVFLSYLSANTFAENSRNMDTKMSFLHQMFQNTLLNFFSLRSLEDSLCSSFHLTWDIETFLFSHIH